MNFIMHPYFFDLTSFQRQRQKLWKNFRWFFGRFEDTKKDVLKLTDLQYFFVLFVLDNSILASEFAWPSFFFISNLDKFRLTFDSSFHCTFIHVREENSLFSELQGLQLRNFGVLKQILSTQNTGNYKEIYRLS